MAEIEKLALTVYSDVLCPWCYNAAVRLHKLAGEYAERIELEWKSYLLRPYAEEKSLEKFRRYTESWQVPASQADGGRFRVWATDEAPPSHSIPPNVALKAAARQGAHDRYQLAVMDAYFYQNRNVTNDDSLIGIAAEIGLDRGRFASDLADPETTRAVVADHREAHQRGVSAVPTLVAGDDWQIPGAQDLTFYRHVIDKALQMTGF